MNALFSDEKIVHRDLKPENILLDEYGKAFVSDVGIAKQFTSTLLLKNKQKMSTIGGDENWMAPEMFKAINGLGQNIPIFHSKLDVFSLGLITLKAIDRDNYDNQAGTLNIDKNALENYLNDFEKRKIIKDEEFLPVLRKMLSFDIDSRISIEHLYQWMVI